VIVAALTAGAVAGTQDAASSAIKDTYAALKALLRDRLKGRKAAETALEEHEKEPEVWESPLKQQLAKAGVDKDPEVLARADELLAAARSGGSRGGDVYNVDARRASRFQVGPGNVQNIRDR
jgi:hypothetical protein